MRRATAISRSERTARLYASCVVDTFRPSLRAASELDRPFARRRTTSACEAGRRPMTRSHSPGSRSASWRSTRRATRDTTSATVHALPSREDTGRPQRRQKRFNVVEGGFEPANDAAGGSWQKTVKPKSEGQKTLFFDDHGWLWHRLIPQRRKQVDEGGRTIAGVPVHISRYRRRGTTVNLLDRPADFSVVLPTILAKATARKEWLTLCYPVAWSRRLRRTVRELVPELKLGKNYWPSAWRIYGKYLK